ncbi:MAG: hypothetical protein ABTD50_12965 [Polyangiaceae bacterium]|jgi:hypothetical protein
MIRLASAACLGGMLTACGSTTLHLGDNDSLNSRLDAGGPDATVYGAPSVDAEGYVSLDAGSGLVLVGEALSLCTFQSVVTTPSTQGGTALCVSGTVAASDYEWCQAGFDVNDPLGGDAGSLVLPSGATSLRVYFTQEVASPLRIQLGVNSNPPWCHYLTGGSGQPIPLADFSTECWVDGGGGSFFEQGTAITAIHLEVPGNDVSETPFNFCFLGLTLQ